MNHTTPFRGETARLIHERIKNMTPIHPPKFLETMDVNRETPGEDRPYTATDVRESVQAAEEALRKAVDDLIASHAIQQPQPPIE
jgi:hypothetical protein